MLRALIESSRKPGGFLAPVLTLVSGTAVAHIVTAGALLVLTRLYSPEDFGVLGLFSSIAFTVAVAMCLRFEIAIPLVEDDGEAMGLLWLSIISAVSISVVVALLLLVTPDGAIADAGLAAISPYLWLLPLSLLAFGLYSALQNWFVRNKAFRAIAQTRVLQSICAAGVQIGFGLLTASPIWLIIGFVMNSGAASIALGLRLWRQALPSAKRPDLSAMAALFRKHSAYPKYSTWEALANSGSIQIPIIIIGVLTSPSEVGYLMVAMSVIQAPMALVGTAAAQVFAAQAPAMARSGELRSFSIATLKRLFAMGGLPVLVLGLLAPFAFPIVFGPEWQRSGTLVAWMTPWLFLQFLSSPLSMTLYITGNQRAAFALQCFGLTFRVLCAWAGSLFIGRHASEAYALSGAAFYGVYLWLIFRKIGESITEFKEDEIKSDGRQ